MRLSDLRDKMVRTLDGKSLGRVHEVHIEGARIVALMAGSASLIERLTAKQHGHRIPWDRVTKVDAKQVTVAPEGKPKKAAKKPSAPRTRKGTRRPSGQRSKR